MNILALETAADPGSVALWRDGCVIEKSCPGSMANSETLLPLASQILRENGLRFADLDGLAFGMGPGSFTSLRVACGAAQGLAVAADLPLIGVVTLDAMAACCETEKVLVALDARMGEVYYAFFVNGGLQGEIGVSAPDGVPLPESSGWLACGNGLAAYPALRIRLAPFVDQWRPEVMPSAAALIRLALVRLNRGERIDPADAAPLYVRNKVAKTVAERLAEGGKA